MTRTVVIAGVGPGLGSSLARTFAARGDDVALLARSTEYLHGLADEITDDTPGDALAV
ncbi:MAG: short-chain dehydrogenase, partial [Halobaculum sp.]